MTNVLNASVVDGSLTAAILKFATQLGQRRLGSVAEDDDAADERGGRRLSMTSATVLSVSVDTFSPTPAPSPLPSLARSVLPTAEPLPFSPTPSPSPLPSLAPSVLPTVEPSPLPTVTAQPPILRTPTAAPSAQAKKRNGSWRFLSLRQTIFAILAASFVLSLLVGCVWCCYAARGRLARDEAPKDGEEKAAASATANSSAPPDGDTRELGANDSEESRLTDPPLGVVECDGNSTPRSLEVVAVSSVEVLEVIVPRVVEKKVDGTFFLCEDGLCGPDEFAVAEA